MKGGQASEGSVKNYRELANMNVTGHVYWLAIMKVRILSSHGDWETEALSSRR